MREAARASTPLTPATPERPKRRTFTAEYKQRILREADAALASGPDGAVGELLRREGLYSSHLTEWRRAREAGALPEAAPVRRGPTPAATPKDADRVRELEQQLTQMTLRAGRAGKLETLQKKLGR